MDVVQVVVPDGVQPGMTFPVQTASGAVVDVCCPEGACPGQLVDVSVPQEASAVEPTPCAGEVAAVPPAVQRLQVGVPEGIGPGQALVVQVPWGGSVEVLCPDGVGAGQLIEVSVPAGQEAHVWVLKQVEQFMDGDAHFLQQLERFCLAHQHIFGDESECRESSAEPVKEFPVAYHQVHKEFVQLIEALLEQFVSALGLRADEFVEIVRGCGLHAGSVGNAFLRSLDAMTDFDIFMAMVHDARKDGLL